MAINFLSILNINLVGQHSVALEPRLIFLLSFSFLFSFAKFKFIIIDKFIRLRITVIFVKKKKDFSF